MCTNIQEKGRRIIQEKGRRIIIYSLVTIFVLSATIFPLTFNQTDSFKFSFNQTNSAINTTSTPTSVPTINNEFEVIIQSQLPTLQNVSIDYERICSKLLRPYIILRNHKTGWVLGYLLQKSIIKFCKMAPESAEKFKQSVVLGSRRWEDLIAVKHKRNKTCFHFSRNPLDTIISGYFYHLTIQSGAPERWATLYEIQNAGADLSARPNRNHLYEAILNDTVDSQRFYSKYMKTEGIIKKKLRYCFDMTLLQTLINTTNSELYPLKMKVTLQMFYKLLHNHSMGLWWEFVRYFNCNWPTIYVFRQIGINQYFNNYIEFRLKDFALQQTYDRNMNMLLDGINFIDNTDNNHLLKEEGIIVNISSLRNELWAILQTHYIPNTQSHQELAHTTKNMYDKQEIVKDFLQMDPRLCLTIKNMTLFIDQEWIYTEYC